MSILDIISKYNCYITKYPKKGGVGYELTFLYYYEKDGKKYWERVSNFTITQNVYRTLKNIHKVQTNPAAEVLWQYWVKEFDRVKYSFYYDDAKYCYLVYNIMGYWQDKLLKFDKNHPHVLHKYTRKTTAEEYINDINTYDALIKHSALQKLELQLLEEEKGEVNINIKGINTKNFVKTYNSLKEKYPDTILLFRDEKKWYYTINEDAIKVMLATCWRTTPHVAAYKKNIYDPDDFLYFPYSEFDNTLKELQSAGYRVAIVEEKKGLKGIDNWNVTELNGINFDDNQKNPIYNFVPSLNNAIFVGDWNAKAYNELCKISNLIKDETIHYERLREERFGGENGSDRIRRSIIQILGGSRCANRTFQTSGERVSSKFERETRIVKAFAEYRNIWHNSAIDFVCQLGGSYKDFGSEARVYFSRDENYVFKIKNVVAEKNNYGNSKPKDLLKFFDELTNHNILFPETKYEILGFGLDENNNFCTILKQKAIKGQPATSKQIEKYFSERGFKKFNNTAYYRSGFIISDLKPSNVVYSHNKCYVIDCFAQNLYDFDDNFYINLSFNGLLGALKSELDTAALKLLESVKDTELKKLIKTYFSEIPQSKGKVRFLCFSKNAAYVSNGSITYKIKCNVPKDLVGKSSSFNKTFEQVESIFTSAEKNKQGIKYTPNTFSREHIKYMFDKYNVLKFSTCKYYFGIDGLYFDTEYLQRCLKHSGKVFKSSLWGDKNNILYSQSDEVDYVLMSMYVQKNEKYDLTLVDYINDKVVEEYNVTNSIEYIFETDFDFFNKVTLEKYIKYALRVVELKQYKKELNYYKQLNNAYKLLTGKECAEIPNVNLNVYKDNKLNLSEFTSDDERRPFMWCIGYQNGYACATDSYLLVAVKDQYIKSREGKTYNILGYKVEEKFPTIDGVIKEHFDPYKRITFDIERLKKAITLAKKLPKGTAPIVRLESGVCFNADNLEKVLYFLDYCTKPEIYLTKKNVLYIKDENEVHNLILTPFGRLDYNDNSPIDDIHVSIVDLKYHYNPNRYWGKEKDKIDAVVKGNCVTPDEDTKLQRLELQLLDEEKLQGIEKAADNAALDNSHLQYAEVKNRKHISENSCSLRLGTSNGAAPTVNDIAKIEKNTQSAKKI